MIRWLAEYQVGQRVRSDGPQTHLSKAGTPTMGGALILAAIVAATLLWADLAQPLRLGGAAGHHRLRPDRLLGRLPEARRRQLARADRALQVFLAVGRRARRRDRAVRHRAVARRHDAVRAVLQALRRPARRALHPAHVLRDRRLEQRGQPDRRARRPRDHAVGARRRRARRVRVRVGQRRVLELPRHPVRRRRGRGAGDLRRDLRRRPRLPVVQHVSRAGVHGRHRRAGARRRARRHRRRSSGRKSCCSSWAACSSWRRCR